MVYYEHGDFIVRDLEYDDVKELVRCEIEQGWNASEEKYLNRLKHQQERKCISLAAEYRHAVAGYINVYFDVQDGPFAGKGYPEIVDFGVLEKYRNRGVGSCLMDVAERIGFGLSDIVCIGVGLHSGYGSAQRMYVKRGYIPDGSGVWYQGSVCEQYSECCNDDDLVLYMSKIKK